MQNGQKHDRRGMTPRERWLTTLRGERPDRVPMDYRATGEATDKLMKHLGCSSLDEVFERLHAADRYPGTGIGLAISRKIAILHGGDLDVTSAPGMGATFTITLPDGTATAPPSQDTTP